jgi:hypothetical protein
MYVKKYAVTLGFAVILFPKQKIVRRDMKLLNSLGRTVIEGYASMYQRTAGYYPDDTNDFT